MGIITRKRTRKRHYFIWLLVLIAVLLVDSNFRIVTTEYEVTYSNLPVEFDGYRIVQLSDIHAAEYLRGNGYLAVCVEKAEPDIIALTGDIMDGDGQLEHVRALVEPLTEIAPVYYVTGNHEWDSGYINELFEMLESIGVHVMRNEYTILESGGASIVLAGAEDPNGRADMKTPAELIGQIREETGDRFLVVLNHRNDRLGLYADLGVDLVLSGHAHGGVVRLPFTDGLVGPHREFLPTNTSGVYSQGKTNMVVSRGLGNHTSFPRILNNPHIAVAVLRAGE